MASTPTTLYHLKQDAAKAKAAAEASKIDEVKEVIELPTSQTSVYHQGQLVSDANNPASDIDPANSSMNELLQWAVAHSDPEELKRRAEAGETVAPVDKDVRDMLLGGDSDAVRMRRCVERVLAAVDDEEKQLDALEELEFYVETIDNAIDLPKVGGFDMIATVLSDIKSADVAAAALSVLAVCAQNNPGMQQQAADAGFVTKLIRLLQLDSRPQLRKKAATALSALVRGHTPSTQVLLDEDGVAVLVKVVEQCNSDPAAPQQQQLTQRILFMLVALAKENPDVVDALATASNIRTTVDLLRPDSDFAHYVLELLSSMLESKECGTKCRTLLTEIDAEPSLRRLHAGLAANRAEDSEEDSTQLLQSLQHVLDLLS